MILIVALVPVTACAHRQELKIPATGLGAQWISHDPPDPLRVDVKGLDAEFRAPTIGAPSQYGAVTMIENCVLLIGQYEDKSYYDVAIKPNEGVPVGGQIPNAQKDVINYLIKTPPSYCT